MSMNALQAATLILTVRAALVGGPSVPQPGLPWPAIPGTPGQAIELMMGDAPWNAYFIPATPFEATGGTMHLDMRSGLMVMTDPSEETVRRLLRDGEVTDTSSSSPEAEIPNALAPIELKLPLADAGRTAYLEEVEPGLYRRKDLAETGGYSLKVSAAPEEDGKKANIKVELSYQELSAGRFEEALGAYVSRPAISRKETQFESAQPIPTRMLLLWRVPGAGRAELGAVPPAIHEFGISGRSGSRAGKVVERTGDPGAPPSPPRPEPQTGPVDDLKGRDGRVRTQLKDITLAQAIEILKLQFPDQEIALDDEQLGEARLQAVSLTVSTLGEALRPICSALGLRCGWDGNRWLIWQARRGGPVPPGPGVVVERPGGPAGPPPPINITVKNAPLSDVMDLLMQAAGGGNVLWTAPGQGDLMVEGVRLKDVPLPEALQAVCAAVGLEVEWNGQCWEIRPRLQALRDGALAPSIAGLQRLAGLQRPQLAVLIELQRAEEAGAEATAPAATSTATPAVGGMAPGGTADYPAAEGPAPRRTSGAVASRAPAIADDPELAEARLRELEVDLETAEVKLQHAERRAEEGRQRAQAGTMTTSEAADLEETLELAKLEIARIQAQISTQKLLIKRAAGAQAEDLAVLAAGCVKAPGAYVLPAGSTVLDLLAMAGGLADRGDPAHVTLMRTAKGPEVRELDISLWLDPPQGAPSLPPPEGLMPGDVLVVPEKAPGAGPAGTGEGVAPVGPPPAAALPATEAPVATPAPPAATAPPATTPAPATAVPAP